jgi:hypothetical protein
MKTNNKEDIRLLKSKHRLELVMQETGENLEVDAAKSDLWRSKNTPGLSVNVTRQLYELARPGMDTESGDVIAWLQSRYGWSFGKVITYLQKRKITKHEAAPVKKKNKIIRKDEDKAKPLDHWQEKALEIGGERIREYFSWSWDSLVMYIPDTRIEPVHAPSEEYCGRCGEQINWHFEKILKPVFVSGNNCFERMHDGQIPVIAYSIKRRIDYSCVWLEGSNELKEVYDEAKLSDAMRKKINWAIANSFDSLIYVTSVLFVEEEDGIVCAKCACREYDFQIALKLCRTSAYRREEAEREEQSQRDCEAAIIAERERADEEERLNDELFLKSESP